MKLRDYDDFDEELLEEDQKEPEQKKDGEREPSGEREAKYLEAKGTFEKDTGKTGVLKVLPNPNSSAAAAKKADEE